MSDVDVKRLRELEAAATEGPWHSEPDETLKPPRGQRAYRVVALAGVTLRRRQNSSARPPYQATVYKESDAALIAALRNDAPALLDAYEERERLRMEVALWRGEVPDELAARGWARDREELFHAAPGGVVAILFDAQRGGELFLGWFADEVEDDLICIGTYPTPLTAIRAAEAWLEAQDGE